MNLHLIEVYRRNLKLTKKEVCGEIGCDVAHYNKIITFQGGTVKKFAAILDILGLEIVIRKKHVDDINEQW